MSEDTQGTKGRPKTKVQKQATVHPINGKRRSRTLPETDMPIDPEVQEEVRRIFTPIAEWIVAVGGKIDQIANAMSTIALCAILATIVMFVKACG